MPVRSLMCVTNSMVRSRVLPPAPYVTDTKPGSSERKSSSLSQSWLSPAAVFGGKNSNEKHGFDGLRRVRIFTRLSSHVEESASLGMVPALFPSGEINGCSFHSTQRCAPEGGRAHGRLRGVGHARA